MKKRWKSIFILLMFVVGMLAIAKLEFEIFQWKEEVKLWSQFSGTLQSLADFRKGEIRILRESGKDRAEFSSKKEDDFEIWDWPCSEKLGLKYIFGQKYFIDAYNQKMRFMKRHPENFKK